MLLQIVTTVPSEEDARRIAQVLLQERLAACVQIHGPLESHYWWKDALETSREWCCIAKTTRGLYSAVEQSIRAQHPYEVPEIIGLPIAECFAPYQQWLLSQLNPGPRHA